MAGLANPSGRNFPKSVTMVRSIRDRAAIPTTNE
jgi:hypothetical protein